MKKQLLFIPLVGLLCFTSCNKSRELSPVDDKTGLERAAKILAKETAVLNEVSAGNISKLFDFLPHKLTIEQKLTINGNETYQPSSEQLPPMVEVTYNNVVMSYNKYEINYDTLQFCFHQSYDIDGINYGATYNFFYDNSDCYFLMEMLGQKIKTVTQAADKEKAKEVFYSTLEYCASMGIRVDKLLLPTEYLTSLIVFNDGGNNYTLLEDYKVIQDYINLYCDNNSRFNYQFGSNDENSFSLRTDLKLPTHILPNMINTEDGKYYGPYADGHTEGYNSIIFNEMLYNELNNYSPLISITLEPMAPMAYVVPDLVVFEDNYLTYASSTQKVDSESLAQLGLPAGVYNQHTTETATFEATKGKADINNPNPDDYDPAGPNLI